MSWDRHPGLPEVRVAKHSKGSRWDWMLAAVVAVIPLAAGVFGVLAYLAPPQYEPAGRHLEAAVTANGPEGYGTFSVPLTAPWATFPVEDPVTGCGPRQFGWLRQHGQRQTAEIRIRLRNNAPGGAQLTVRDFRVKAQPRQQVAASVTVDCAGASGGDILEADLDADTDKPAVRRANEESGTLTVNLTPGEENLVVLRINAAAKATTGVVAATVQVGAETSELAIGGDTAVRVAGSTLDGLTVSPAEPGARQPFSCRLGERTRPCSAVDFATLARQ
ncbi:hypothetical protein D5S17_22540 [Pseudonocardiaceae bacterium YIM PH 21723]|nr:hypothetical protein D5S17_22540 [Pseudonocardiaceae bacterium YIM PH 21723]